MKTDPGWEQIPGETPIDDVSGLLLPEVGTRRQLNQVEAENIAIAASKYLVGRLTEKDAPFTFDWVFDLHKEMFGNVWNWAGKPRNHDLNLGSHFYDIEADVKDLVDTIPYWGKGDLYPLIADAAFLHYRAVKIHPFVNGNGRWSRMLANIWLRKHGAKPTLWPVQIGEVSPIREAYIAAIKAADKMEFNFLIELHTRHTPT